MAQKKAPNAKGYIHRLGYLTASSSYNQQEKFFLLSGSSLNREILADDKLARGIPLPEKKKAAKKKPGTIIHRISPRRKPKIKNKCLAFYESCGQERVFLTLTFIDKVADKLAARILNKFWTALRLDVPELEFLWVAERQSRNPKYPDNIHFHAIINRRLDLARVNAMWVMQQYNSGLRNEKHTPGQVKMLYDRVMKGERSPSKNGRGITDPMRTEGFNPVDVRNVKNVGGLSSYLTKYITKNTDGFECLAWHCSRKVSKLAISQLCSSSVPTKAMGWSNYTADYETGEICLPVPWTKKFFTVHRINRPAAFSKYLDPMREFNRMIMAPDVDIGGVKSILVDTQMDDDTYRHLYIKENFNDERRANKKVPDKAGLCDVS